MTVRKRLPVVLTALVMAAAPAIMQAGEPGEAHAELEKLAGTWNAMSTTWMAPGAEPQESEGTVVRKMLLGGRVLQEHFHGDIMGMPFEGIGLRGYDSGTGRYWGLWMDNTSTAAAPYEGSCSADYVTCEFRMTVPDPATGKAKTWRMQTEQVGDDTERFTVYEARDGEEFKSRVTVYQRTL